MSTSSYPVISCIVIAVLCFGITLAVGPRCYHCTSFDVNYNCSTVTRCPSNEVCMLSRAVDPHSGNALVLWGCIAKQACDSYHSSLIGRRSAPSSNKCFICCGTELCNRECMTPTKQPPPTLPVCSDTIRSDICQLGASVMCHNITMATKIGCKGTCGFC